MQWITNHYLCKASSKIWEIVTGPLHGMEKNDLDLLLMRHTACYPRRPNPPPPPSSVIRSLLRHLHLSSPRDGKFDDRF